MAHESTTQERSYLVDKTLYMAFELSKKTWRVRSSSGGRKTSETTMVPGDEAGLSKIADRAKEKFGLTDDCRVVSCFEAGRDGFWPHRFLEEFGIRNIVVDAASMKVSRQGRRKKNDKIDVRQLLNDLVRFDRGDDDVWRIARVPGEQDEDDRRPHREIQRLKKERTQHRSRILSLFATQGVQIKESLMTLLKNLDGIRIWNGELLPEQLKAEIEREHSRLKIVESQIAGIKAEQRKSVKEPANAKVSKIAKMQSLRGIGLDSSWLITMELCGWRTFNDRRGVGGSVGLGGTPYDSGEMEREQGISKTGNSRVRTRLIELGWLWLQYQPNSDITVWFNKRFRAGGKRARRVGIVAVARRLLIELWHFVEHDVEPRGAIIVKL